MTTKPPFHVKAGKKMNKSNQSETMLSGINVDNWYKDKKAKIAAKASKPFKFQFKPEINRIVPKEEKCP